MKANRWSVRKQKAFDKTLKDAIITDHKKESPYSKKYPKGVKYNSYIQIEFQQETDRQGKREMRGIVFDDRDKTVHDYYGKTKKEIMTKIRKDYKK